MDVGKVTSTISQGAQQVQGQHHHRRHMSVDKMESAIDQAVKSGNLTDSQATAMKKVLEDIKTTLANAKASGTALTDDQQKQIHDAMKDIGKQLFAALTPTQGTVPTQGTTPATATGSTAAADLFAKIDSNSDGNIDKDEFTKFASQLNANSPSSYNQKGSFSITMIQQSTISITA